MHSIKVIQEKLDSLHLLTDGINNSFIWRNVFTLPDYLRVWSDSFHTGGDYYLGVVKERGHLLGVAPLLVDGQKASFIGSSSVCDYMDFSIISGKETLFFNTLFDDLERRGVKDLDLQCLRPESTVLSACKAVTEGRGGTFKRECSGVSMEVELPQTWDDFLSQLSGKQRHEIRRKIRRLQRSARANIRVLEKPPPTQTEMDCFIDMFRKSRTDKDAFMDDRMEAYFRLLINTLGQSGVLKLYALELNGTIAAMSFCFDFQGTVFLYNSCYDSKYKSLSVGTLCNVLTIRHSIDAGRKKFDFLKGDEPYKYHLGGYKVPLSRVRIRMSEEANT